MNKTFKVIFKKEIGDYVVCNECKTTHTKGRAKRLPLICMCAFLAVPASATVVDDFNSVLAGNGQANSPYIFTDIDHSFTTSNPVTFTVSGANNSASTALLQFGSNSSVNISSDDTIKFTGSGGIAVRNNSGLTNISAKEVLFLGSYSAGPGNGISAALVVTNGKLSFGSRDNPIQRFKLENGAGAYYWTQGISVSNGGGVDIYSDSIDISSFTGSSTIYSEGVINLYSKSVSISNTKYNETNTKALNTGANGVINIFSDSVSLSTVRHSPVYAVGQSTINITAKTIQVHAKGNPDGNGFSPGRNDNVALLAHVGGTINLVGEEITLTAPNDGKSGTSAIVTSLGSSINVSATKKLDINGDIGNDFVGLGGTANGQISVAVADNATMTVHGNVDIKTRPNSGDTVNLKAGIGSSITTKGDISTDNSPRNFVNISLDQQAKWAIEGNNVDLHELKSDNGFIDLSNTASDANVSISSITGSSVTVAVDRTDPAKINAQTISCQVNVQASAQLNDNSERSELLELLSGVVRTDDIDKVTLTAQEGLIADAFAAQQTDDGVAIVSETKNTYVQAVSNLLENQTIEFRSQINDVSKRMGDLRTDEGNVGAWVRVYGGKNKYQTNGVSNKYRTLQMGGDTSVRLDSGRVYVGLTGLYKEGDSTLINGSAEDESFGGGLYSGYLADNGWYLDFIAKYSFMQNDFSFTYSDGRFGKGKYKTKGVMTSLETGFRVMNEQGVFVEPQLEFMYGHINGFDYVTSAGVHGDHDSMKTIVARSGISFGKVFDENRGSAYFNVSILNDFDGKQSAVYSVNNRSRKAEVDIGGAWVEAAVGGTYKLGKNFYVYGELSTSHGTEIKNPFQWNIGGRLSF